VPEHCGDTGWVHFEYPEGFPERNTSQGHSKCTENSLSWEIAVKLTRKILNVTAVYWVGIWSVHYPFPCNVFAMYQVRKPHLAPSVWIGSTTMRRPSVSQSSQMSGVRPWLSWGPLVFMLLLQSCSLSNVLIVGS